MPDSSDTEKPKIRSLQEIRASNPKLNLPKIITAKEENAQKKVLQEKSLDEKIKDLPMVLRTVIKHILSERRLPALDKAIKAAFKDLPPEDLARQTKNFWKAFDKQKRKGKNLMDLLEEVGEVVYDEQAYEVRDILFGMVKNNSTPSGSRLKAAEMLLRSSGKLGTGGTGGKRKKNEGKRKIPHLPAYNNKGKSETGTGSS